MNNDRFLKACRRQEVDRTPVWLMRQAGRYMPEFRALRAEHDFLTRVKTPELAAEITLQPIKAFDLDAAIVFADIIPPLEGMGLEISFAPGPTIHNPVRSAADIAALRVPDPRETVAYSLEAVRLVKRELAGRLPLIGFSGAPFTLASYAIEGGGSRDFARTRALMYGQPAAWHQLMAKLSALVGAYLVAQAEAGADALQLFDSWAGVLSPFDYAEFVLPYVQQCIATVRQGIMASVVHTNENTKHPGDPAQAPTTAYRLPTTPPIIYFGTDMGGLHALLRTLDADVLGADWRVNLDEAWAQLGPGFAIQGNLDPHALLAPWPLVERRAADILDRAAGRPGHIFNLGHGILPDTPVENVRRLVEFVHSYDVSGRGETR